MPVAWGGLWAIGLVDISLWGAYLKIKIIQRVKAEKPQLPDSRGPANFNFKGIEPPRSPHGSQSGSRQLQ